MEILVPFDVTSVSSAVIAVGGTALLVAANLWLAFRLARKLIARIGSAATPGGSDSPRVAWAVEYIGYGTNHRKLKRAYAILQRRGIDASQYEEN